MSYKKNLKTSKRTDRMGLLSRREFYNRAYGRLEPVKKKIEWVSVAELYKEAKRDAPYRQHSFLFKKPYEEICRMPAQEQDGLKDFNYQTEGERLVHVEKEIKEGTAEMIRLYRDKEHPTIKHISNGFHRIYTYHRLGIKKIQCEVWYGYWVLDESIELNNIVKLLEFFQGVGMGGFTIDKVHKGFKRKAKLNKKRGVISEMYHC